MFTMIFSCLWACVNFVIVFDTFFFYKSFWCFFLVSGHENLTQNSLTDVWPWWPSSECYWAYVLNPVWMISIALWVYVCADSELMWLIFSDPNILRPSETVWTFCDTKVLPGRPHWLCLGWLGLVHWLSAAQRSEKPWLQHLARVGEAKDRLQPEICFGVVFVIVHWFFFLNFLSINFRTL